jgi:hypothetical protein
MTTVEIETDVAESRAVTIALPPGVPTGRVRLTVTAEPVWVPPYRPDDPALVAERQAFLRLLPDLLTSHPNQYVAVYQGRVVAVAGRPDAAEQQARAVYGNVPVYVGVVHPPPPPGVAHLGGVRTPPAGAE